MPGRPSIKHTLIRHWPLAASAALLLGVVALYLMWPACREFIDTAFRLLREGDTERLQDWIAGYGKLGPLLIIMLMVAQMFLVVVPSWLLMFLAVLAYGPWAGTAIAVVAVLVASSVGYAIGLFAGNRTLDRLLGRKTAAKVQAQTDRYGLWAVVVTRLNPLLSNDAISFVGGMLRLGFLRFLLATLLGILPLAIAIAVLGQQWEDSKTLLLWLSIASLAGLGVKILLDHRKTPPGGGRADREQ